MRTTLDLDEDVLQAAKEMPPHAAALPAKWCRNWYAKR
jgi:hypothetical protein